MKIAVARETRDGETRVAMVPELVGKLTDLGYEVLVEPDAGARAEYDDELYVEAGATVTDDLLPDADVVVSVNALPGYRARLLRDGAATISFLPVNSSHDLVTDLRDLGITSFAMELVPRISRAQSMDALSSQALVAGYRCAIVAAGLLRRFFPLNMTAAGTVQPAQVVVLGAGVAGLQAIATVEAARCGRPGLRRARRRRRGDPVDGREVDRPRARDPRGLRWLRPRDDRGPGRPAARAADAVHRQRRRADHDRRRARPARRRCW